MFQVQTLRKLGINNPRNLIMYYHLTFFPETVLQNKKPADKQDESLIINM
jgi:hypothetical protein